MSTAIEETNFATLRPVYEPDRGIAAFPWASNPQVIKYWQESDTTVPTDEFKLIGNTQGKLKLDFKLEGAALVDMLDFEIKVDIYALDKTTLVDTIYTKIDPADGDDNYAIGANLIEYIIPPRIASLGPYVKLTAYSSMVAENTDADLRLDIDMILN